LLSPGRGTLTNKRVPKPEHAKPLFKNENKSLTSDMVNLK